MDHHDDGDNDDDDHHDDVDDDHDEDYGDEHRDGDNDNYGKYACDEDAGPHRMRRSLWCRRNPRGHRCHHHVALLLTTTTCVWVDRVDNVLVFLLTVGFLVCLFVVTF